ncbi:response regulator [Pseudovibrio brasiliensis]|uniref:response regulator n=1 Tax=Pseudovibrio brasiliensis TaxID=1898042 RepID=UPI000B257BFD|nr:response regulator [Pseudovibrio brasiliensis]
MLQSDSLLSGYSVLIVDDNNYMRSILRTMVSGFGVRSIYEAGDGADAIAILLDRRPDIVLCDWIMHPIDGNDFLRILRQDEDSEIAKTPVIVITADSRRSVVVAARNAGVNYFLAKPIAPAILYDRLKAIVMQGDECVQARDMAQLPMGTRLQQHLDVMAKAKDSGTLKKKSSD